MTNIHAGDRAMSVDKEFEDWFSRTYPLTNRESTQTEILCKMIAEQAFRASRESLMVELPPPYPEPDEPEEAIDDSYMDAYYAAKGMRHACSKSIEAAGLKVKS